MGKDEILHLTNLKEIGDQNGKDEILDLNNFREIGDQSKKDEILDLKHFKVIGDLAGVSSIVASVLLVALNSKFFKLLVLSKYFEISLFSLRLFN